MFKSYLKATLRNLWKNKTYSFLNIFGLAIGIVCAGVIFLWVEDEVNFDSTYVKRNRLYSLQANWNYEGSIRTFSSTPGLAGPAVKDEIPGIANTCRMTDFAPSLLFNIGEKSVYASGRYAEASLFDMFTLPFAEGNAKTAFKDLDAIVITQKTAKKFFGDDKNIVGRRVKVDNQQEYVISGVLKDLPENSTLQFDWVLPFQIYFQQRKESLSDWLSNSPYTYVELEPNADPAAIDKKLYNFIQQKNPQAINHLFLFSMNDWRLRGNFENGKQVGGRITYVRMFSLIAWIILLIACINFMNLATARSEKRAREVGVRKVMGAGKSGLIAQFIGEALLMAMFSCILAVLVIWMVLPAANALMGKNLTLGLQEPVHILALLVITLICGLVAGSYPSLYLSSFNAVAVLKGLKTKTGGAAFIRKGLVVLQFSISIMLIICTAIIYQQIQHVKSRDLGFNKEHLLSIDLKANMLNNFSAIRQDLLNTGMVENVALSDHPTIYGGNNTSSLKWQGKPENSDILISTRLASSGFIPTMGMQLMEGRDFNAANTDSQSVIITSSLAKMMGAGSALGKKIEAPTNGPTLFLTVVGVVKDYVYGDMYASPDPVMFYNLTQFGNIMYLRLKGTADPVKAVAAIEKVITKANPGYPFEYTFVDDQFNDMFQAEMLVNRLSRVFAGLAIIISCLGLFGLAAYTAERRTKEIGIRKVLGASVAGITGLLSRDFLQLVIISCAVAFPLAWWAMSSWLQQYAYRVSIHWWIFLLAGIAAVMISLITISFQSVRAALANPVKSLKAE
ncbi:ABC transporter permease [Chitinophaga filiformis]|uniref:Duplicated orphan permease n=1 Tax=Chitinophaga filiformis TaxID=104663 RepID=A0A1G7U2V4_CHIFI|nr:ABC transporter permease [Chitinophaga filiformis]SDG41757.1 duplicated orphan permease [Chitinophaga filiformis]